MEEAKAHKYKYEMLTVFNTDLNIEKQLNEDKEYLMEQSGYNLKFWKDLKEILNENKKIGKKIVGVAKSINKETGENGLVILQAMEDLSKAAKGMGK